MKDDTIPKEILKHFHPDYSPQFFINDGWIPLVLELNEKLEILNPNYILWQCKEKFGGLRYYISNDNPDNVDEIFEIINYYENKSYNICDICGNEGKHVSLNGWMATRCEEHEK